MKRLAGAITMFLWAAVAARGQIDFRCRLVNTKVLQFESIPVEVTIGNNTGEPLVFGGAQGNATLLFDIESTPGMLAAPTGQPVLTNRVTVKPAETAKLLVDLLPAYGIRNTGPYSVTGRLEWRDKVFVGGKLYLDVLPGLEIARTAAGIPGMPGQTRTYSLRTLSRDRGERVFLRITDDNDQCYGVVDLGSIVRMYKPVLLVDEEGNIQVVHQNGPSSFVRNVVTPYGLVLNREAYTGDGSGIRLKGPGAENAPLSRPSGEEGESAGGEAVDFEELGVDAVRAR
jgi:hypothetical protein